MAIPNKPTPNSPVAPFISDTNMWSRLLDMLAAWERGDLTPGTKKTGWQTSLMAQSAINVEAGLVQQISGLAGSGADTSSDSATQHLFNTNPLFSISDPVWQASMDNLVIVTKPIMAGVATPISSTRYVAVPMLITNGSYRYAMVDPADSKLLISATGGPYRIMGHHQTNEIAILDTQEQQRLWRFTVTGAPSGGTAPATLKNLDKTTYANITLTIEESDYCQEPPFDGFCIHVGNDFYAISTEYALLGNPKLVELDPNLRIVTDGSGNKSLCVDKFRFMSCGIEDYGDSCVEIYECP